MVCVASQVSFMACVASPACFHSEWLIRVSRFRLSFRRVQLWLNRRIVKYEFWFTILPILRLIATLRYLCNSPLFPIMRFFRFFRLSSDYTYFSDSPIITTIYTILRFFQLYDFSIRLQQLFTRFFDFSDYTTLTNSCLVFKLAFVNILCNQRPS